MIIFFNRSIIRQGQLEKIFKIMKEWNNQPWIIYPTKLSFRYEGEIKNFPNKN